MREGVQAFSGTLCKAGHDDGTGHSIRYRSNLGCAECQRLYAIKRAEARPVVLRVPRKVKIAAAGMLFRPEEWLSLNIAMIRRRTHPADRESYLNGVEIVWGFEIRAELEAALTITEAMAP